MFFAMEPAKGLFRYVTDEDHAIYHVAAALAGARGMISFCKVYSDGDDVYPLAEVEGSEGTDYTICPRCKAAMVTCHQEAPEPAMLVDLLVLQTEYARRAQGLAGDPDLPDFQARRWALFAEIARLRQQATLIYSRYALENSHE